MITFTHDVVTIFITMEKIVSKREYGSALLRAKPITLAVIAALYGTAAWAQEAAPKVERVEITGSKIRGVDMESSVPTQVISRAQIEATGATTLSEVLQTLSIAGEARGPATSGGDQIAYADLRGIGFGRTLVLVNGHRWVGSSDLNSNADLSTIPLAAVERIEVLKDGGSVLYGADAMVGLINIKLKERFQGTEVRAGYGSYENGLGASKKAQLTTGYSNGRFNGVFSAQYNTTNAIFNRDYDISSQMRPYGSGNNNLSDITPAGGFRLVCDGALASAKKCAKGALVDPSGKANTFTYNPDQAASASNWHVYNRTGDASKGIAADGYNNAGFANLLVPLTQKSVVGNMTYELSEHAKFKLTAQFMEASTVSESAPTELSLGSGGVPQGVGIQVASNSFYNPYGLAIGSVRRALAESPQKERNAVARTAVISPTVTGDFNFAQRSFDWEVGAEIGRTIQTNHVANELSVSSLKNALGPSFKDASGNIVCGTPGNVIQGCVPMNILGNNTITPEMMQYLRLDSDSVGWQNKAFDHDYFATISSSDLLALPAGGLGFAGGFEKHIWSAASPPIGAYLTGDVFSGQRSGTSGRYASTDFFGEFYLPLLKDLPLVKKLDLSIAARHSDFSNDLSSVNKKFGLKWKVNDDLALRGSFSTGYRTDVSGLVLQLQDTAVSVAGSDPCSYTTNAAGAKTSDRYASNQAACAAAGVPAGGYDSRLAPGTTQRQMPNTNIGPETDNFRTFGLVYSPSFARGFDLTIDYWNVTFANSLYRPFGSTQPALVQACLTTPGDPHLCPGGWNFGGNSNNLWVIRDKTGAITDVRSSQLNSPGGEHYEGIDLNLNFKKKNTPWGNFGVEWTNAIFLDAKDPTKPLPSYVGVYQNNRPIYRLRSNLAVDIGGEAWSTRWTARYFSGLKEDCTAFASQAYAPLVCNDLGPAQTVNAANGTATYLPFGKGGSGNTIPAYILFDVSGYYKLTPKSRIKVGVNNLFDHAAPRSVISGRNYVASFGIPSRFAYVEVTQQF